MLKGNKSENETDGSVDQMTTDEMNHTGEFHLDSNWLALANDFDLLTNNRDKVWENNGAIVANDGEAGDGWWKVHLSEDEDLAHLIHDEDNGSPSLDFHWVDRVRWSFDVARCCSPLRRPRRPRSMLVDVSKKISVGIARCDVSLHFRRFRHSNRFPILVDVSFVCGKELRVLSI